VLLSSGPDRARAATNAVELALRLPALMAARSRSEIADATAEVARLATATDASWCALRDGDALVVEGAAGIRDPEFAETWRLPLGTGMGGRVAVDGRPVVVRDYARDPRRVSKVKTLIDSEGMRSSICVPVVAGDRIFGVIYVTDRRVRAFEGAEVDMAAAIGRGAGVALAEYERRSAAEAELAALRDEGARLRSARDDLRAVADTALAGNARTGAALDLLAVRMGATVRLLDQQGVARYATGPVEGGERIACPIRAAGVELGALEVVRDTPFDPSAAALVGDVARLMALELRRERAALETELRLNSAFLDELLDRAAGIGADELDRRAALLGMDPAVPAIVLSIGTHESAPPLSERSRRAIAGAVGERFPGALVCHRPDEVVVIAPVAGAGPAAMSEAVQALLRETGRELCAGLGRIAARLRDCAASYTEASTGRTLAATRPEPGAVLGPSDLGLYAILAHEESRETLQSVVGAMLGPLLEADEKAQSEYVKTLSAFLANDRHHEHTAAELHVHVNTLRYRLAKIQDITGVDLHEVNSRFLLELALRIHAGLAR
jgi:sugar diacid utilization regulator/putative methionine-R-sulfoxide reductase with GAF domain